MRRDANAIFMGNDIVAFMVDTLYDRRNALFLGFNPIAARTDGQVANERGCCRPTHAQVRFSPRRRGASPIRRRSGLASRALIVKINRLFRSSQDVNRERTK